MTKKSCKCKCLKTSRKGKSVIFDNPTKKELYYNCIETCKSTDNFYECKSKCRGIL